MDPFFLIMLAGLVGLMFFMSSRQRKQAREQAAFRESLQPGSRVMTTSGLIATVVSIDQANEQVTLESAGFLSVWTRAAIARQVEAPVASSARAVEYVPEGVVESDSTLVNSGHSALSELDTVAREYQEAQERDANA